MRKSIIHEITERAKIDKSIVLLTGDLGYGCIEEFSNLFPDRYFNAGIAEQNMMSMAAGLAIEGKKVFVYSIGNFDSLRCIEQIRNDVCYMNLDVNIIAVGAGVEYGQLGFSHHATEDIACMRSLPNMMVFDVATVSEAVNVAKVMLNTSSPIYLRLNKKGVDVNVKAPASLQPYLIKKGKDIAIFSTGAILSEALKASELLLKEGIDVAIYSCPAIKPLDSKSLMKKLSEYKEVFTLEEHTVLGGLGGVFAEVLAQNCGVKPNLTILGIRDCVSGLVGDRTFLRKEYKIDAVNIAKTIYKKVKK